MPLSLLGLMSSRLHAFISTALRVTHLLMQGFSEAQQDVLHSMDERIKEEAKKEYARQVKEEETERVAQVEKEAAALERKYAR